MRLYYIHIGDLADMAGLPLLSPERRACLKRYRQKEDRVRCLAAGLLLRRVLGQSASRMTLDLYGKPNLPDGPCFNLSHSGQYVILGVSSRELGVDVEQVAPWRPAVAQRCFTPDEQDWLFAQQDDWAFYRLWTAKESIMKATGLGFQMSPGSFTVLPMEEGIHQIHGTPWYLRWLVLPGHQVCTASASSSPLTLCSLSKQQLLTDVC